MMNYNITIFGLIIVNLMNWLDGILTYIALYIVPKGIFYETNIYALNMFNTIGFFSSFVFKIVYCLAVTLLIFLIVNKPKLFSFKKKIYFIILNNILFVYFIFIYAFFCGVTINGFLNLIKYYF